MKFQGIASILALLFTSLFSFSMGPSAFLKLDPDFKPEVAIPYFKVRHPVILFDQAHMNMASDDGRYAPLIHLLESDGFVVKNVMAKFTPALLSEGNILYIASSQGIDSERKIEKNSVTFTDDEVETVQSWVKNGGSLLMMAEHSPNGDGLHSLAAKFQVSIGEGEINDPQNYLISLQSTSNLLFTNENHLLMNHPIIFGRTPHESVHRVAIFSAQSVKGPSDSKPVLGLSPSAESYLKNGSRRPVAPGFCAAVAFRYGKGRVIVFGDSGIFTAKIRASSNEKEGMNREDLDNAKLATNTFRWLAEDTDF